MSYSCHCEPKAKQSRHRHGSDKGSPEGFPSGGGLGVSPNYTSPPLLEERGSGGEVKDSDNPLAIDTEPEINSDLH